MSFYDNLKPPSSGYRKLEVQGSSIDLTITGLKMGKAREPGDPDFPVLVGTDNQTGEQEVEFACGSAVLYRLVHELRPGIGQRVLITFKGYDGRVKLYDMQVAGGAGPAPAQAAPPVAVPPAEAYAQQPPAQPPAQPQPDPAFNPAPSAPWGGQPPAQPAPAAPPAAPWGQ